MWCWSWGKILGAGAWLVALGIHRGEGNARCPMVPGLSFPLSGAGKMVHAVGCVLTDPCALAMINHIPNAAPWWFWPSRSFVTCAWNSSLPGQAGDDLRHAGKSERPGRASRLEAVGLRKCKVSDLRDLRVCRGCSGWRWRLGRCRAWTWALRAARWSRSLFSRCGT